jgi:hypothetical protein
MSHDQQDRPAVDHAAAPGNHSSVTGSAAKGRRQFIKKAIVTAPVILTVASRPVWARNCTWSGQLSGNLSDTGPPCGGEGCTASYWIGNTDKWHYEFCINKYFDNVFGIPAFPNATLLDVINGDASPNKQISTVKSTNRLKALGIQSVAALQNSATRVSFDWEVCEVINYFVDCYQLCSNDQMDDAIAELSRLNSQGCFL